LTTIFELSKNDILCDLTTMHKCRAFLTVVEKEYYVIDYRKRIHISILIIHPVYYRSRYIVS
jgi:hypothetical protein